MKTFTVALIAALLCLGGVLSEENSGFENFLAQAMKDYPAWLIENKEDPLPAVYKYAEEPATCGVADVSWNEPVEPYVWHYEHQKSQVNVSGEMWGDYITGHGKADYVVSFVNLLRGDFTIEFEIEGLEVNGYYRLEGEIALDSASSTLPISGSGRFHYHQILPSKATLIVRDAERTPDGYLDLSTATISDLHEVGMWIDYFEGLTAGGLERDLKQLVFQDFDDKWDLSCLYRMTRPLLRYLEHIFSKNTLESIAATPAPSS